MSDYFKQLANPKVREKVMAQLDGKKQQTVPSGAYRSKWEREFARKLDMQVKAGSWLSYGYDFKKPFSVTFHGDQFHFENPELLGEIK